MFQPIFLNEVVVKKSCETDTTNCVFQLSHIGRVYVFRAVSTTERWDSPSLPMVLLCWKAPLLTWTSVFCLWSFCVGRPHCWHRQQSSAYGPSCHFEYQWCPSMSTLSFPSGPPSLPISAHGPSVLEGPTADMDNSLLPMVLSCHFEYQWCPSMSTLSFPSFPLSTYFSLCWYHALQDYLERHSIFLFLMVDVRSSEGAMTVWNLPRLHWLCGLYSIWSIINLRLRILGRLASSNEEGLPLA